MVSPDQFLNCRFEQLTALETRYAIPTISGVRAVRNPQPRFTPSRPRGYRLKVAMGLHHYRFLERDICPRPGCHIVADRVHR